jgi:uncharacterized Rmd1/YagE family protein
VEVEHWSFEQKGEIDELLVDNITFNEKLHHLSGKLAVASGLAQNVKLTHFEQQVEQAIELVDEIPQHMAKHGALNFSRKVINRKYGELLMVRTSINLHSDVLDLPQFFFEIPEGQETYEIVSKYLQISRRARILNERLELLTDVYTMLSDDRSKSVSHRLEWLIIVLISVEIVVALVDKH